MADPALYNAILEDNKSIQTEIQKKDLQTLVSALSSEPWNTENYSKIPLLESPTGCLCVYDSTSGNLRTNACCLWTVPPGTTLAQFQMWGAGGPGGIPCCCGGSNFGTTGAFATVIISVTPGDTYTLCAGCSVCCYPSPGATVSADGQPSYVIGPGLNGVCADGGEANKACGMTYRGANCCRYQNPNCTVSGPCYCACGSHYCFSSCATCGIVPWVADPNKTFRGSATNSTVFGLSSVFDCGCLDSINCGYHTSPPQIDICHQCRISSCCCFTFTSGTCCGGCRCRASSGVFDWPGAPAFASHMSGGSVSYCGDTGRGGMVRVTWC